MGLVQIIFLIIGIGIIALGIYVKVQGYRMLHQGKKVTAVVAYAEPLSYKIAGEEINGYKNVIHIQTEYGVITQELQEEKPRNPQEQISGYYMERTNQFMKEEDVQDNSGAGPYVLIGFGFLVSAIVLLADWMEKSRLGAIVVSRIFSYGICLTFIIVGIAIGISQIKGRKEEKKRARRTRSGVVDYREESPKSIGWMGWLFAFIGAAVLAFLIMQEIEQRRNGVIEPLFRDENRSDYSYDNSTEERTTVAEADSVGQIEKFDVDAFRRELNSDGYCYQYVSAQMPENTERIEYFYMPLEQENGVFGYQIAFYENGVGQLTLFPSVTVPDRSFQQGISFWCGESTILKLGEDLSLYQVEELCEQETEEEAVDYGIFTGESGEISEYIYYFDGNERKGSGGVSIHAEPFGTVRAHMIDSVPDEVWTAANAEMTSYYAQ